MLDFYPLFEEDRRFEGKYVVTYRKGNKRVELLDKSGYLKKFHSKERAEEYAKRSLLGKKPKVEKLYTVYM